MWARHRARDLEVPGSTSAAPARQDPVPSEPPDQEGPGSLVRLGLRRRLLWGFLVFQFLDRFVGERFDSAALIELRSFRESFNRLTRLAVRPEGLRHPEVI